MTLMRWPPPCGIATTVHPEGLGWWDRFGEVEASAGPLRLLAADRRISAAASTSRMSVFSHCPWCALAAHAAIEAGVVMMF
jgi:hypothetical protein